MREAVEQPKAADETVKFSRETISECWGEAQPLARDHHDEVGLFPKEFFKPSLQSYMKLELAGLLSVFTARKNGDLIGYQVFVCAFHPDYPELYFAQQASFYLKPENRKGRTAMAFLSWADETLRDAGCLRVIRNGTPRLDLTKLFVACGYAELERHFVRAL